MTPRLFGAVALALALAGSARAQETSLNRPGSGARAAGMGNAFIAVSDDGTAASWNPAGLSQLRKPEFSLVHSTSWRRQTVEGYRSLDRTVAYSSLTTPTSTSNIEFVSAALPLALASHPVTVQFGWRRLYQFSGRLQGEITRVPTAAGGLPAARLRFDNSSTGNIHLWTVAAAVRLTSRLSVGAGADFYRGGWEDRGNMSEDPGITGPPDFLTNRATNRIGGHSFNLGVLLAFPSVRVGAVMHGPLKSRYEVDWTLRSSLVESEDISFGREREATLRLPRSVGVGVAWLPRPLLRFAADMTYDEWTRFLIDVPETSDGPVSGFDRLPPELSATRNTVTVNAGMERLFPVRANYVPLRLGVSYEPQGGRSPYVRENADQVIVAGGTGLNSNSLKVDVALEYRWGSFRSAQDVSLVYAVGRSQEFGLPLPPETVGSTRIREWRLKLSLIYRLDSAGRIWDLFRKPLGG